MFYNAKNGSIPIDDTEMDYISFGNGNQNLVMIPGLGDALKTVKGSAAAFAWMYRLFAKDYRVYVFSRKNKLKQGCSTRDMAADLARAMNRLGITSASVLGVSQGGMIAQYLAVDFPGMVEKLILAVTLCRQNETSIKVISRWILLAENNDFKSLFIDMAEKIYTPKRAKAQRPFNAILAAAMKPKSLNNFLIQAAACITHDSSALIRNIRCPVLIAGGDEDKVLGGHSSKEIAQLIKGSKLKIYHGYGHGTYEEAKDFNRLVLEFLNA